MKLIQQAGRVQACVATAEKTPCASTTSYLPTFNHLDGRRVPDIEAKLKAALASGMTVIANCAGSKAEASRLAKVCKPCRFGVYFDYDWVVFEPL
jgi:hypothetical protein